MCFRSESLAVYSCINASVSSREGSLSVIRCSSSPGLAGRIRCRSLSNASEIYEPFLRVCREQLRLDLVSNVDAFLAAHQSSFHRRVDYAHVSPRWLVAGDDRLEALSDAIAEQHRCRDLPHLPLDLARRVLLNRTIARNLGELVVGVRRRSTRQHRLHYSLRDEVGVPPIGSRRVGVVLHGETEVPGLLDARLVEDVFAGTEQLHHCQRKIREV